MKADSKYAPNTVRKKATMSPTEVLIEPRSNLVLRKAVAETMPDRGAEIIQITE